MLPICQVLPLLMLHAATVSPSSVPARGHQEVTLALDRPGMVRITAASRKGTSCQLLDQLRGPFASSGKVGRRNCALDELLDAGTYKLKLQSPRSGKDTVSIQVESFRELNASVQRLEPRRSTEQEVHSGQQASYWVKLDQRGPVTLRVSGRTAGKIALWRGGEWLEDVKARNEVVKLRPGQPIHEWWIETVLESGDYLLTVYGARPRQWTRGQQSDLVSVEYGFPSAPADHTARVVLPEWGLVGFELPREIGAAFASLASAATSLTVVGLHPMDEGGSTQISFAQGACRIEPKALVPECLAVAGSTGGRRVLLVRGAPGTAVDLQWSRYSNDVWRADGDYGPPRDELRFTPPASGRYLLAVHDIPLDFDSLPISCSLEQTKEGQRAVEIASDLLEVGPKRPFDRAVNYDGKEAFLWFRVVADGKYQISTNGDRKNRCEVFRLGGGEVTRLTETQPDAQSCKVSRTLSAGNYQLALYGGTAGIDRVRIAADGAGAANSTGKSSCFFAGLSLDAKAQYRLALSRGGDSGARGFALRPLPLTLDQPLPLVLEAGASIELPIGPGSAVVVTAAGGKGNFTCSRGKGAAVEAKDGRCEVPSRAGPTLGVSNRSDEVLLLSVRLTFSQGERVGVRGLAPYAPKPSPPPVLAPDRPTYLDFEREDAHSLMFEVKEAGLYHVATEGLLATECAVRSPAVPTLSSDRGGGRGRNCLVATYLRPGKYLVTARTVGASRGRGALVLNRRQVRQVQEVLADGEAFFSAGAGELIQQRLSVKAAGSYALRTAGQGVSLQCRLDDAQGWPMEVVPTACVGPHRFLPGNYLWTQLPLTVDSVRHTVLEREKPPTLLSGNEPHPVELNTWYSVKLGSRGEDWLEFTVPAELDVDFVLTDRMQGRLYAIRADRSLQAIEMIPESSLPSRGDHGEGTDSASHIEEGQDEADDSALSPEEGLGEGDEAEEAAPQQSAPPLPSQRERGTGTGKRLHLSPGRYRLVSQHSRGDIAILYRLYLGSESLAPGLSREVAVPSQTMLRVPEDGTIRLRSNGEVGVRCRVFGSDGRLRFEGRQSPDDWNCSASELLPRGDYAVVLEPTHLIAGKTRLSVSMPQLENGGELANGSTLHLRQSALRLGLPTRGSEVIQEVRLRSARPFSCVLEREGGHLLERQTDVQECAILLRNSGEHFQLRLWTLGPEAELSVSYLERSVAASFSGRIPAHGAVQATIQNAGRYRTAEDVFCLPAAERGLLRPCGPEASLERGLVVFAPRKALSELKLPLEEEVLMLRQQQTEALPLSARPLIQRQRSTDRSLHLLTVVVPFGERASPGCELRGGIRELRANSCFAASGATVESTSAVWSTGENLSEAQLTRSSVALPSSRPLKGGKQAVEWSGSTARFNLPVEPARLELTVPENTWVVQLDGQGNAVDLCAPQTALSRCVLSARGGELVLHSSSQARAEITVVVGESPTPAVLLSGLYEERASTFGQLRFTIAPSDQDRVLSVSGAQRCTVSFADGHRAEGCETPIPKGLAAQALVAHEKAPLRAVLHRAGEVEQAEFGLPLPASPGRELPPAQAIALSGSLVDRSFALSTEASVWIHSDSGVCALYGENRPLVVEGWDGGCDIHRPMSPGRYRVLVRPFGDLPLRGSLAWTSEPIEPLAEGVAAERWIAAGQIRLFRFQTRSSGRVGLGIQVPAEQLTCQVYDDQYRSLGEGCQQYLSLEAGGFYLAVRSPLANRPMRFRPVLVGLAGSKASVPDDYLRDFFQRIGESR